MRKRDVQIILLVIVFALAAYGVGRVVKKDSPENYVVIHVGQQVYEVVSLDEPKTVVIDRDGKHNEIKITREGVVMHDSNCEGQDCVKQGEARLDNIDKRILGGFIICLPNEISIELVKGESK